MWSALRSIGLLWVGSLGAGILAFAAQVVLARHFRPDEYGAFAAAFTTIGLLAPVCAFGVPNWLLKIYGREGWRARQWLPAACLIIIAASGLAASAVAAWAWLGPHDERGRQLLLLLIPFLFAYALVEMVSRRFQLEARYRQVALWQTVLHACRLGIALAVALAGGTIYQLAGGFALLAAVIAIICGVTIYRMSGPKFRLHGHGESPPDPAEFHPALPAARQIGREAWPFAVNALLYLIFFQSAIVIIETMLGPEKAGIYNVAFVVMAGLYLFPSAVFQKFLLAKIHRWAEHDRARMLAAYRLGNGTMLAIGLAALPVLYLLLPGTVVLLFGHEYGHAVDLLMWLILAVPVRFLSASVSASLFTKDNITRKIRYMATAAILNVVLNLFLLPILGLFGAVIAMLAAEVLLLGLYLYGVSRHIFAGHAFHGWTLSPGRLKEVHAD